MENYFENRLEEGDEEKDADEDEDVEEEDKEERWKEANKTGAVQLVAILKTVEDPEPLLLELFDTLCRFFAQYWDIESHVAMSCPCHPDPEDWHCVNAEGFQLLELVEGMMGTSLQQIRGIEITSVDDDCDDDFRKALAARLARQTETIEEVKLQDATFWRYNELNATILEKAKTWDVHDVSLEYFGEEEWSWFAKHMQQDKKKFYYMKVSKQVIALAKKEDLKTVWNATNDFGSWSIPTATGFLCLFRPGRFDTEDDLAWTRLEEIWEEGRRKTNK